jgi:D-galacturonate reductase
MYVINSTDYAQAIGSMKPGDVAIIFTPDDTHFAIASAAITAGLHVLVAKPIVKNLQEHKQLVALAKRHNVLVSFFGFVTCYFCCLHLDVSS